MCVCVENETVQGMNIPDNVTILILYGNNLLLQNRTQHPTWLSWETQREVFAVDPEVALEQINFVLLMLTLTIEAVSCGL